MQWEVNVLCCMRSVLPDSDCHFLKHGACFLPMPNHIFSRHRERAAKKYVKQPCAVGRQEHVHSLLVDSRRKPSVNINLSTHGPTVLSPEGLCRFLTAAHSGPRSATVRALRRHQRHLRLHVRLRLCLSRINSTNRHVKRLRGVPK